MGHLLFDEIIEVAKFNPYHDARGRFASENGGNFYATAGKSKAHDNAIAREKERRDKKTGETAISPEEKLMQNAIADHLKKMGVTVHDDNTVTLYHVTSTDNAESIKQTGFRGTEAPVGGMTGENIKPRSFFGFDKEWVESTWGGDGYTTLEIRVPAQYIRQGAQNQKEVYIEGNIKDRGNGVWHPDELPTSTFYDRKAIKRYVKENGGVSKSSNDDTFNIFKTDDDKRLVFGWASISVTVDGEQLEDRQKDIIDPEDLEAAAYEYVLNFRDTGEEHIQTMRKKGKLVESCVFTEEKQQAMGIPEGIVPVGWWIGFKIEDDAAWERVKNGTYKMFSIEGKASREPVQKAAQTAMTFEDVLKYNDNHDALGRFASANGVSTGSIGKLKPIKPNPKWAYQPDDETDVSDMVENPIPFVGVGTDMDLAVKFEDETIQSKYISNTEVRISELKTLQPFVLQSGIEDYKPWDGTDRPYVVDFQGQKYVIDGNHRIAQAKIRGEKTVNVDISVREQKVTKGETPSSKSDRYDEIYEITKFNPYHDADGKFTSANVGSGATSSAGGFKKAATIEEATEYARKELGFSGEVDFSYREKDENGKFVKKTLDVETVNSINEQIAEIQSKYPELKGYVKDLYCDDLDHSYAAINYSHEYGEASLIIGAGAYKNGIQAVKEQYAKDVEKKFHPYGTDERAIIWHEYGHAYAMQQAEKTVPAGQKSKAIHEHHMEKSWMSQATNKLLDDPKVRMEYEMLGMNLTPAAVKSAISNVSKYAQKDVVETFAEQFAAHHCRQSGKTNMYGTALLEAAGIKVQKSMPVADGWNR